MKTKEELNELKSEVETLAAKLAELDDSELEEVIGGDDFVWQREENSGTGAWYGMDNSKEIFEPGSRFWVRWLEKDKEN